MTGEMLRPQIGEEFLDIQARQARIEHLGNLKAAGIDPYPILTPPITHTNREVEEGFDTLEGSVVGVAGRIMARREHAKRIFYDILDWDTTLQIGLVRADDPEGIIANNFDPGDFVHIRGIVFKTRAGQVTVGAETMTMLAKALRPPPIGQGAPDSDAVRFGIIDKETARRRRWLELLSTPEARARFRTRFRMVQLMREQFLAYGFLEVETPVLETVYGGANAKPFVTHMNALDQDMYLRIANEINLKKLVGGHMGPVFEFSRNFRNEGMDDTHNPEFTAVELYLPYADYNDWMDMAEKIFERLSIDIHGTTVVEFKGQRIDFKAPWRRLSIYDGVREAYHIKDPGKVSHARLERLLRAKLKETFSAKLGEGVDPSSPEARRKIRAEVKAEMAKYPRRGDKILKLFEEHYDGKLIQPTFVIDYPKETSPLTKTHRQDPALVERFECYVGGFEVMNAYSELNDPQDQRQRFEEEKRRREEGGEDTMPMDEDFLMAMEHGFPPMGGIGISIDRFAMIHTNTPQIKDVLVVPPARRR